MHLAGQRALKQRLLDQAEIGNSRHIHPRQIVFPAESHLDTWTKEIIPGDRIIKSAIERAHAGEKAVVMPTLGGSVPLWAFTDILKLPTYVVPYANANNRQHSPNEHLKLDHLFQGIRTTATLLQDLAALPGA